MPRTTRRSFAPGLAYVRVIAFLLAFAALLVFVCYDYVFPATDAALHASPRGREILAAHSSLLLAILLFILLMALILTFRIGRFFVPRNRHRERPTNYPDAWAEAAKRIKVDDDDQTPP